jgi:hypothetical protein
MTQSFSFRKLVDGLLQPRRRKPSRSKVRRLWLEELESRLPPAAASFSIATANVIEPGSGGTDYMDFTVTRSGDLSANLSVAYTTVPGNSQSSAGFTPVTGEASFTPGATTATIKIPIFGPNGYNYPNLTFSVQLTGVSVVGGPVLLGANVDFAAGTKPVAVTVADLNGDGKPDIIVANSAGNNVSVLLNTTPPGASIPTFAHQQTFATGANPVAVTAADLNGDGKLDLVVADDASTGLVSILMNTTAPGAATATFANHVDFAVGANPIGVAAGDLNGDGLPDLAVANSGANSVSVLLNTTAPGATTPSFAAHVDFATGTQPSAVAIADLNGDGKADLAVADRGSNKVSVLANLTAPGATIPVFAASQDFSVGMQPDALAIGDLNGDGRPDLAVVNAADGTVSVLLNTTAPGSGTFTFAAAQSFQTGASPQTIAIRDLNGDGKGDLVVGGDNSLAVLENTTVPGAMTPTFATRQTFATGAGPNAVAVADFNGDGLPDVVTANSGANSVSVLLNRTPLGAATEKSTFTTTTFHSAASQPVILGDINGDGKPDIIVSHLFQNYITVLINTTPPGSSTPTFGAPQTFAAGNSPSSVSLADINGDGKPDIIVGNQNDGTISVLINTTPPGATTASFLAAQSFMAEPAGPQKFVAVGDFNGDGKPDVAVASASGSVAVLLNTTPPGSDTVSFTPQVTFATGPGPSGIAVADFNGDGRPDLVVPNYGSNNVSVLLNTTPTGALVPTFAPQVTFAAGNGAKSVAVGDLNGDGKPDIVVVNDMSDNISVLVNKTPAGATVPSFAAQQTFGGGSLPTRVALGDINGDGKLDIVFNNYFDGTESLLLNTTPPGSATVSFSTQVLPAVGKPGWEAIGDINGDGRQDIVVSSQGADGVVLLNAPATITTASATATIDDVHFTTAAETVNKNGATFSISVVLSVPSPLKTTIPFTLGGTAIAGTNYSVFTTSPLVIPAGQTSAVISGTLIDDHQFDGDLTLTATLGTPTNATVGAISTNTLTIHDNSTPPTVAFAQATQSTNENASAPVTLTVNLSAATHATTTIPFSVGGSAVAGANYNILTPSPLVIPAGQTSATIAVAMVDDGKYNTVDQTLTVTLGTPTNATLGAVTGDTLTIHETDAPPTLALASATQTVNENAGTFSVQVNLSTASSVDTTVPFTLGGTAAAGTNYGVVASSPLVIPAGQTSASITGTLIDDGRYDTVNKTLTFTVGTPTNATLGAVGTDTLTINETDPPPTVSFASGTESIVAGPSAGTVNIPVNLSAASNLDTTIPFTLGGTAVAGTDYTLGAPSPLIIPAGQPSGSIRLSVMLNPGSDKTLTMTLGTPTNGILGAAIANTLTIHESHDNFLVVAPNAAVAGAPFIFTVTAWNSQHNPDTAYSGTVHFTSTDPSAVLPADAVLTGGFGYFLGTVKSAGVQTVSATDVTIPLIAGVSTPITVTAGAATSFAFSNVPASAVTGKAFNMLVTAFDQFGNDATNYAGHVHFTSSDPNAVLPADTALTHGAGVFSFSLATPGNQTISATDSLAVNPVITGTSSVISTRDLVVSSFAPAADGFTATFSKAFDPSKLTLYGSGLSTVQDVTLVGAHNGPIPGTIYVDPSNQSVTFKATESYLESFFSTPVLPDDTYTVTLVSLTTSGFGDGSEALDGANNAGHANYTATFTTANQSKTILSLPDFARGPDGAHNIQIPNDTGHGIPVTLTNAAAVSAATFTLNYNPALLTVTGASSLDATTGGTLTLLGAPTIIDASHATANFQYTSTAPQNGTVVLGGIVASVPDSAASKYKAKELLTLSSISINGATFSGVATSAVHVNAYFGDLTGNGSIDALDVAFANNVARGASTGFDAYTLLDPAIIGDVAGDISVDAGDVSTLAAYVSQLPTPRIPAIPTGLTITPTGPDPMLSLVSKVGDGESRTGGENAGSSSLLPVSVSPLLRVSVQLDDPRPAGSTGMTEAVLALTYDPFLLNISPADITFGSIPGQGNAWQLNSYIDAASGQIAIVLYSTTPIASAQPGGLVNLAFHVIPQAGRHIRSGDVGSLRLVNAVTVDGHEYTTQVDDAQGQFVLSPGVDAVTFTARAGRAGGLVVTKGTRLRG